MQGQLVVMWMVVKVVGCTWGKGGLRRCLSPSHRLD